MLIYLSKKIAIPHQVKLSCISWNHDQGWIACGGEGGLLKVLKLEVPSGPDARLKGIAAPSNLSMNQTLEGHTGAVMCATWNPLFKKLTTSDANGLIIVWMLHKGLWYEEMINNRNKSVVRDMKWTADGRKICIIYEDGAVIVGSVDGNRLWGKELGLPLRYAEWSPDCKLILFATADAEVWIYDSDGTKLRKMSLAAQMTDTFGESNITGIHWFHPEAGSKVQGLSSSIVVPCYNSSASNSRGVPPSLCIAFESGLIQLSTGEDDVDAVVINTGLNISYMSWDSRGTLLAVVGSTIPEAAAEGRERGESKDRESKGDGGAVSQPPQSKSMNMIKFYDPWGRAVRSMRIPGEKIAAMSWEGSGLRISLAVDSYIFFANIRPDYTWTYLLNTVVYAYNRGHNNFSGSRETCLAFWEQTSGEVHVKHISNLKFLVSGNASGGDLCAVVYSERADNDAAKREGDNEIYKVQLRNAIGAVVATRTLTFVPRQVSMGACYFAAVGDRTVYTWQFQSLVSRTGLGVVPHMHAGAADAANPKSSSAGDDDGDRGALPTAGLGLSIGNAKSRERMFDIDMVDTASAQPPESYHVINEPTGDPITCSAISDKCLVVARRSGTLLKMSLPHLSLENTYAVKCEPSRIELNCNSSKLALVDGGGTLSVFDLDARVTDFADNKDDEEGAKALDDDAKAEGKDAGDRNASPAKEGKDSKDDAAPKKKTSSKEEPIGTHFGKKLDVERRDVWDVRWAEDNADLLCVMEKTKMVVLLNEVADEPVVSSGYLARFRNLEIRVVTLDELLSHPEQPTKDCVIDFETKTLREARDAVASQGLHAGLSYAERTPHPSLWRLFAHAALEELDLPIAERAFVQCSDYHGVQLVQQLRGMPDKMKAKAEVAAYQQRYDEAEAIYREIDRKDLAIQLRKRSGDYVRVVQLLQTGGGSDRQINEALNTLGEHYADRFKWRRAAQYFAQSRNLARLAECHFRLDNFAELSKLRLEVADGTPLLSTLGPRFEAVGMAEEAVDCYVRAGDPKAAVDCCVALNRWSQALELAERYDFPQVEGLLTRFAGSLLTTNRHLQAVELYRVANKPQEAALLTADVAEQAARALVKPLLAKKLHILAALEVERHRKKTIDQATQATLNAGGVGTTVAQATAATLDTLMMTTLDTQTTMGGAGNKKKSSTFSSAWRGAAAYHYYMLAHKQFYAGNLDQAMKTAIRCCEYDDVLSSKDVYSLLCVTALKNKFFGVCSRAFVKLETLPALEEKERDEIQTLAVKIFVRHAPVDPATLLEPYIRCLELGKSYKACTISGRAIMDSDSVMCKVCRHSCLTHEKTSTNLANCPLCHAPFMGVGPVGLGAGAAGGVGLGLGAAGMGIGAAKGGVGQSGVGGGGDGVGIGIVGVGLGSVGGIGDAGGKDRDRDRDRGAKAERGALPFGGGALLGPPL